MCRLPCPMLGTTRLDQAAELERLSMSDASGAHDDSMELLRRWEQGDEAAADEIFVRYVRRLAALARGRLSERMKQRVDPDDVVQSAYRSFFRQAREGRFELMRSGDLWRLLAAITVNKAMKQVERHTAAKRSIHDERRLDEDKSSPMAVPVSAVAREPTVPEAIALIDEVNRVMRDLEPLDRQILELRLQDYSSQEIAGQVNRSTRTVRRRLEVIKHHLQQRLTGS